MKSETLKEIGKFLIDLSKITIAITFLTPLVRGDELSIVPLISASCLAISGFVIINKGSDDD